MTKLARLGAAALLLLAACAGGCGDGGPDRPAHYTIDVHNGWVKTADEEKVGGFLESAWHDPVGPDLVVDTRLASETGTPMANAQIARIQTSKLPGYRERGVKRTKLRGRPAVLWSFDVPPEESRIEFLFEECDTAFIVRGSMKAVGYAAYASAMREMAATIKADCEEE